MGWASTTLLIDDGSSALMTDGFFSRPGLAQVGAGKAVAVDCRASTAASPASGVDRLDAVSRCTPTSTT